MEAHLENCIFCKIIHNKEPSEKIYEDDYVTCIKDINPVSTHHYLILPNKHIRNAKELKNEDTELYDKMVSTVDKIIEKQCLVPEATRTGFHWPPINTVDHLHLHVISPVDNMSLLRKFMFKANSYWFVNRICEINPADVQLIPKVYVRSKFLSARQRTEYVRSTLHTCS